MKWYNFGIIFVGILTTFFIIGFAGYCIAQDKYENDYKRGQVDALTGNIKYELVTHEDMTRTWELIGND